MVTSFDDKGKIFTQVVHKRPVAVTIQTLQHTIRGTLHVRPDQRVKDELNGKELFIAITDATVFNQTGDPLYQNPLMIINTDHVVWVIPEDDCIPS